mgnify:CR=1 FL=1
MTQPINQIFYLLKLGSSTHFDIGGKVQDNKEGKGGDMMIKRELEY